MNHLAKPVLWRVMLAGLFVLSLLALTPQAVLAQDFVPVDDVCLGALVDFGLQCTANDVRVEEIIFNEITDYCDDPPAPGMPYDTMTANLTFKLTAGQADRYDIGLFVAKDGADARGTGACYQDYLAPTLVTAPVYLDYDGNGVLDIYEQYPYDPTYFTGWWDADGDACGDIEASTEVFMTNINVTIACSDSPEDTDSRADVSVCVTWDQLETEKTPCSSVDTTIPGTGAKCRCEVINFDFTPTALEQMSLEAKSTGTSPNLVWGGLGLLLIAGASGSYWLYRRQTR